MKRDEIIVLEGRELDMVVAKASGWQCVANGEGIPPGEPDHLAHNVPFYHSGIAAAWDLVEEMERPAIWRLGDGKWWCTVRAGQDYGELSQADNAPTAIARAFLLAKMEA